MAKSKVGRKRTGTDDCRNDGGPVAPTGQSAQATRRLDALPDSLDFRDRMYLPNLVEVPARRELQTYRDIGVPVLDQGRDGACTGYALATVAHYLLRSRRDEPDPTTVSPAMLYAMAKRYDEWPGENYDGSSCRGAIKGWYKHGLCAEALWSARGKTRPAMRQEQIDDAARRPLGAYFRVNHKDLVAMHAAITEAGVLYASGAIHSGWESAGRDGRIPFREGMLGGHAFAIIGYDAEGFWIQNSWGTSWAREGFGRIDYADWLANGSDVWAMRLGVPRYKNPLAAGDGRGLRFKRMEQLNEIRPHIVNLGNDGQLDPCGDVGTSIEQVREVLRNQFPRLTAGWKKKRLVLYAHGGLVDQDTALQRIYDYRCAMLPVECYPLAFVWHSDYWSTLRNMLDDATRRRRPEGVLDDAQDFMLDRLDDALEPIARVFTGKAEWDEMKENALAATLTRSGGARLVADEIARLAQTMPELEIHVVGHSAGSILLAPLVRHLCDDVAAPRRRRSGMRIASCTLWAPACTIELFKQCYLPAWRRRAIERLALFTLTDKAERDDHCARIYHKSLLYLVSNAFERWPRIPLLRPDGEPLLGMEKCLRGDAELMRMFAASGRRADWILAPNIAPIGSREASRSMHHGDFDDDDATVSATIARIIDREHAATEFCFTRSAASRSALRRSLGDR